MGAIQGSFVAVRGGVAMSAAVMAPVGAAAETILFVGNSFTFGALSPVRAYRPAAEELIASARQLPLTGVSSLDN